MTFYALADVCAPLSESPVILWLNSAIDHSDCLWQREQLPPRKRGFSFALWWSDWQDRQPSLFRRGHSYFQLVRLVGLWQLSHLFCPSNLYPVSLKCQNSELWFHLTVLWQELHSCFLNFPSKKWISSLAWHDLQFDFVPKNLCYSFEPFSWIEDQCGIPYIRHFCGLHPSESLSVCGRTDRDRSLDYRTHVLYGLYGTSSIFFYGSRENAFHCADA